jgi:hypothetical protein
MKNTLRLAFAGLFLLLASAAWCQVIETKLNFTLGAGWGSAAKVKDVRGGANEFRFAVAAGGAHQSTNPQVTVNFDSDGWAKAPACSISRGWTVDDVSQEKLRIHWNGKPRAGDVITASVTCSD